jgi:hypothetical protein
MHHVAIRSVRRSIPVLVATAVVVSGAVLGLLACSPQKPAAPTAAVQSPVERGAYLVAIAGCNDCHTPLKMGEHGPEPDMSRMLSGHPESFPPVAHAELSGSWMWAGTGTMTAFSGPWGISFAANLTPDEETGLGVFTEETFIAAMRSGKHMGGGRPLLPPMPWQSCAHMTDEDLKAVYAYLRSIPPIRNQVPDPIPPPPAPTAG